MEAECLGKVMRTLYFDLDGTILSSEDGEAKESLRNGVLELAVRRAKFTRLVCVGNIGIVTHEVEKHCNDYDAIEIVFRLCGGTFQDINWFRAVTKMVANPEKRAESIDYSSDWWYLDDLAVTYLRDANRLESLKGSGEQRVLVPDPSGKGSEILVWLNTIPV